MSRVFANGLGDRGSIRGRLIPDTKMVFDAALLNTQFKKVRIKGKAEQSKWNGVAPSPTPRCGSYWKGSLRVTLDCGRQLYLLYIRVLRWLLLIVKDIELLS